MAMSKSRRHDDFEVRRELLDVLETSTGQFQNTPYGKMFRLAQQKVGVHSSFI